MLMNSHVEFLSPEFNMALTTEPVLTRLFILPLFFPRRNERTIGKDFISRVRSVNCRFLLA